MKNLIFLFLLISGSAYADLYKCVITDGKTAYQDHPCAEAGSSMKKRISEPESMVGCYEFKKSGGNERWEIKASANGNYDWLGIEKNGKRDSNDNRTKLKRATPDEVQLMSREMHLDLKLGVSFKIAGDTPKEKLEASMGIYKGKDEEGKEIIVAVIPYGGPLEKIPCP